MGPLIPILGLGAAGFVVYKVVDAEKVPELQSLRHVDPETRRATQVVVPVVRRPPQLRVTDVPIAGVNAQVIRDSSPGARYTPPAVVKKQQTPGKLDLLPTIITATGAATLAVMTFADVQNALNTLGYGPVPTDGKASPTTTAAVKAFQARVGLAQDGSPGPQTKAALQHTLTTLAAPGAAIGVHPSVASATASTAAQVALSVGVAPKTVQTAQNVVSTANVIKGLFSGFGASGRPKSSVRSFFGRDLLEEYEQSGVRRDDLLASRARAMGRPDLAR